jgi:hypothetical protein
MAFPNEVPGKQDLAYDLAVEDLIVEDLVVENLAARI